MKEAKRTKKKFLIQTNAPPHKLYCSSRIKNEEEKKVKNENRKNRLWGNNEKRSSTCGVIYTVTVRNKCYR